MWHGGYLGAAYYDDESAQVYLLRDVIERDSFILMKQCKKICEHLLTFHCRDVRPTGTKW